MAVSLSPIDSIKAFERSIVAEVKMGLMSMESACGTNLAVLLARIRHMGKTVPMEQVTNAIEYLTDDRGTFNALQRKEVAETVKSVRKSHIVESSSRKGWTMQSHQFLHVYILAMIWAAMMSADTIENKMKLFATFMIKNLGLRHPDNKTKKLGLVIICIASNLELDPQSFYDTLHKFGDCIERKRSSISNNQTMIEFPQDPNEFLNVYPDAFGDTDPPVDCRIDIAKIPEMMRGDVAPSRSTNSNVVKRKISKSNVELCEQPSAIARREQSPNADLVGLLRDMMNRDASTSRDASDVQLRRLVTSLRSQSNLTPPQQDTEPSGASSIVAQQVERMTTHMSLIRGAS